MSTTEPNPLDVNTEENTPTELQLLKKRADTIGVTYSNNISAETLKQKINDHLEGKKVEEEKVSPQEAEAEVVTAMSKREQLKREAKKLIRVRIQNMNPNKASLPGEIITVGNRFVGTIRRFIPYGEKTENGWHVEKMILDELKSRTYQHITSREDPQTRKTVVTYRDVKEFNIAELDPLTEEELHDLAVAQMAAGSIDSQSN